MCGIGDLCGVTAGLVALRSSKRFSSSLTADEEDCREGMTTPVGLGRADEESVFLEERGGGVCFEFWSLKKVGSSLTVERLHHKQTNIVRSILNESVWSQCNCT